MKRFCALFLCAALLVSLSACATHKRNENTLYQTSTINALLRGVYDGEVTFAELAKRGDFGLGTFNAVDGEMIALDGDFYQVRSDGWAYEVSDEQKTPFAVVHFFASDRDAELLQVESLAKLTEQLDGLILNKNLPHAIRIEGRFDYVRTRSVPRQSKPYRPLVQVVKTQPTFDFHNVRGVLVGYWFPEYFSTLNVPGYHFHFITADRTRGGHVLECRAEQIDVSIDEISRMSLDLPKTDQFRQANLRSGTSSELMKVEK